MQQKKIEKNTNKIKKHIFISLLKFVRRNFPQTVWLPVKSGNFYPL